MNYEEIARLMHEGLRTKLQVILERRPKITLLTIAKELGFPIIITDVILRNLDRLNIDIKGYYDENIKVFFRKKCCNKKSTAWIYANFLLFNFSDSSLEHSLHEISYYLSETVGYCNLQEVKKALILLKKDGLVTRTPSGNYIFYKKVD